MNRRRKTSPRLADAALNLFLTALVVLGVTAGPRLIDGENALEWTRFHAVRCGAGGRHAADEAAKTGTWAARAVSSSAPLPTASSAVQVALAAARQLAPTDAKAARAALAPVREALEDVERSTVRGIGLGASLAAVRAAEAGLPASEANP